MNRELVDLADFLSVLSGTSAVAGEFLGNEEARKNPHAIAETVAQIKSAIWNRHLNDIPPSLERAKGQLYRIELLGHEPGTRPAVAAELGVPVRQLNNQLRTMAHIIALEAAIDHLEKQNGYSPGPPGVDMEALSAILDRIGMPEIWRRIAAERDPLARPHNVERLSFPEREPETGPPLRPLPRLDEAGLAGHLKKIGVLRSEKWYASAWRAAAHILTETVPSEAPAFIVQLDELLYQKKLHLMHARNFLPLRPNGRRHGQGGAAPPRDVQ